MTYCLAIKVNEGLIFCSDSRTNAGPDRVSTYSKLHRFKVEGDRRIFMLSAGNLATTQAVVAEVARDIENSTPNGLPDSKYVSEIADYVGQVSVRTQQKYVNSGPMGGFNAEATFILGGQIAGHEPELYMIYPEGNHITTSKSYPFLQIGETKYGKPILDRIIRSDTDHETAMRCALVSMDSTMRSNATVAPPIELLFYPTDTLDQKPTYHCFEEADEYLVSLRKSWDENIVRAFNSLPGITL